jgi:hypothetical protein
MDWNTFISAVGGGATVAIPMCGAIVWVARYYVDSQVRNLELAIDVKLANQSNDLLTRVNGTYVRSTQQQIVNDQVSGDIRELRSGLNKVNLDMGHITGTIARLHSQVRNPSQQFNS